MAVRWECPNGCGVVLGPQRPRKDDVRRYCLRCSERTGRLVERRAPVLERQRAARKTATAAKQAKTRERDREAEARKYIVQADPLDGSVPVELDLRVEIDSMIRGSQELRDRMYEFHGFPARWRPELTVHRGRSGVSGHAKVWSNAIHLTIGKGVSVDRVREVLLHELVHAVLPSSEWHGSLFRTTLCRAARELFGVSVHPDDRRKVYELDELIIERMGEA